MTNRARSALLLLVALLLVLPGCLVTRKSYNKLLADRDRLAGLLETTENEHATAQASLRTRLESADRELELYRTQASDSKAAADKARQELAKAQALAKQFEDQVKALGVGEVRDGRLVLEAAVIFESGRDVLSPEGRRALDKVAAAFKGKNVLIQVDGHTDNVPVAKDLTKRLHRDNMGLAAHRALAVFRHLLAQGIAERNLYIRAFGESWPVASNTTEESKARNRRVEILFIPEAMVPRPEPE